ncbi:hypothetical protein Vafri_6935 [Volvox africanus]|uniref:Uncharacterized protein n=1 Tax=Volvox africanus TaxID=51714 RepID=A0A8J4EX92_9CHLO|nr:hypothetical protein Vafri_6935 [Volvox africanus]
MLVVGAEPRINTDSGEVNIPRGEGMRVLRITQKGRDCQVVATGERKPLSHTHRPCLWVAVTHLMNVQLQQLMPAAMDQVWKALKPALVICFHWHFELLPHHQRGAATALQDEARVQFDLRLQRSV